MRSRYRISVGGVHLDSLDDNLRILDIQYSSPDFEIPEYRSANLNGYENIGDDDAYFNKTTVTVTFELHIYDIQERNAVCQKVNLWANAGGTLVTNDRENQRLWNTRCEKYASIESVRDWTAPLTVVFATTNIPYWVSSTGKTLSLKGKSAKGTLKMDGNIGQAKVSATVTAEAKFTSFQITAGSTVLKITGITVETGKQLVIDYVRNRHLRVRVDGKSVMANVDPSSSDLLTVPCGANTAVSITASNKVTATITARGLWL